MKNKATLIDTRKNITIWGDPESTLQSQYGKVTYREWCNKEVDRMAAIGRAAVVVEMDGVIAVARKQSI